MDEIMEHLKSMQGYVGVNPNIPNEWKENAQKLCWEYNQTPPDWQRRAELLKQLLGTCDPLTFIEPSFRCDYGFNIHTHGLTVINYNCVILDTSPVNLGAGVFLAPGVCLACAGHALDPEQRARREQVGRLCIQLAREADRVIRVVCGVGQVIKG